MVPGKIELTSIAILFMSVVAMGCDIAFGRIFNWLTISMAFLGLIYAVTTQGWSGLGSALLGMLAGLLLYGWMFWMGVLGGGDVKLLMALGAWGGPHYALHVALLGVLLGGVMALAWLIAKGRVQNFLHRIHVFFLTLIVRDLKLQALEIDRKSTMPFGIAIAAAAVWVQLDSPFLRWGLL